MWDLSYLGIHLQQKLLRLQRNIVSCRRLKDINCLLSLNQRQDYHIQNIVSKHSYQPRIVLGERQDLLDHVFRNAFLQSNNSVWQVPQLSVLHTGVSESAGLGTSSGLYTAFRRAWSIAITTNKCMLIHRAVSNLRQIRHVLCSAVRGMLECNNRSTNDSNKRIKVEISKNAVQR